MEYKRARLFGKDTIKKIEIHIIELEKYKNQKKKTGQIDSWLEFFINPYGSWC